MKQHITIDVHKHVMLRLLNEVCECVTRCYIRTFQPGAQLCEQRLVGTTRLDLKV